MYISSKMRICDEMRDVVFENNLAHGFLDTIREFNNFQENIIGIDGEFMEVVEELKSGRPVNEIYYTENNGQKKREGAPTELADIIIFILDYFSSRVPQIHVDENYLYTPEENYKNEEYYEKIRRTVPPAEYFEKIKIKCCEDLQIVKSLIEYDDITSSKSSFSVLSKLIMKLDEELVSGELKEQTEEERMNSISKLLHRVIRNIIEFCDIYGIDLEVELPEKINFNNSRPINYEKLGMVRKIGREDFYSESREDVEKDLEKQIRLCEIAFGYFPVEIVEYELQRRKKINGQVQEFRTMGEKIREQRRLAAEAGSGETFEPY